MDIEHVGLVEGALDGILDLDAVTEQLRAGAADLVVIGRLGKDDFVTPGGLAELRNVHFGLATGKADAPGIPFAHTGTPLAGERLRGDTDVEDGEASYQRDSRTPFSLCPDRL